jgi:hypothetical protein
VICVHHDSQGTPFGKLLASIHRVFGALLLQLKSPYKDGTTHIVMSPLDKTAGSGFERQLPARRAKAREGFRKRVFDIDVAHCPHCGGPLKIIAAIQNPSAITRILAHLGLPTSAASCSSALFRSVRYRLIPH